MRHDITTNFQCWVTEDNEHFTVFDKLSKIANGGYSLGEFAHFTDENVNYRVTIDKSQEVNLIKEEK